MKILITLLLFINTIFASIIKDVYLLEDNPTLNFENIKTNQNFKRTTKHFQRGNDKDYWVRVKLDRSKMKKDENYLLRVHSRFDTNEVIFDKEYKRIVFDRAAIEIKEHKELYLKVLNNQDFIDVTFEGYTDKEVYEKNLLRYSIFAMAYGILFSAFLYYLAFYIFNRQKSFIYYSLTQLSMLFLLSLDVDDKWSDILVVLFLVFAILFTKEFLNTKKYTPKLNIILTFMIYFYILDFFLKGFFSTIFPVSSLLLVFIFTAVFIYNKTRFKPILFYIIGWSIIVVSFIIIDFQFFFVDKITSDIPFDIFVHIVTPLESLILAFSLSYKMKLLEEEKLKAERMMVHQNKLAAMGEMISNIAHQWRQPLTHLSYIMMNINTAFKQDKLSEKYLDKKTDQATDQLEYMSSTIDDFKNFYMPKTHKESFGIKESIDNALTIISSTLEAHKIKLEIQGSDFHMNGYRSEFAQVLLNLISNAKDALVKNEIKNPMIKIQLNTNQISIYDNAGGIDEETKEKIFDPYFTTKQKGSGLGLYMSKTIIESHFGGELSHSNRDGGSCFKISIE